MCCWKAMFVWKQCWYHYETYKSCWNFSISYSYIYFVYTYLLFSTSFGSGFGFAKTVRFRFRFYQNPKSGFCWSLSFIDKWRLNGRWRLRNVVNLVKNFKNFYKVLFLKVKKELYKLISKDQFWKYLSFKNWIVGYFNRFEFGYTSNNNIIRKDKYILYEFLFTLR